MFRKTFAILAAAAACGLALTAGTAAAGPGLGAIAVKPTVIQLPPQPDLYVSGAASNAVWITNGGKVGTGAFTIRLSAGWLGDTCSRATQATYARLQAMGPYETRMVPVRSISSIARTLSLDIYNEVFEGNEWNNTASVPGSLVIC